MTFFLALLIDVLFPEQVAKKVAFVPVRPPPPPPEEKGTFYNGL